MIEFQLVSKSSHLVTQRDCQSKSGFHSLNDPREGFFKLWFKFGRVR